MADQIAQTFVDNTTNVPKNSTTINVDHSVDNLKGALIIKDFPDLQHVILRNHDLTSVVVENCPKLNDINISNNRNLVKFDLEKTKKDGDQKNEVKVVRISGYRNKPSFEEINLKNCTSLEELVANDLGGIKEIKGVKDFDNPIKQINIGGSEGFHLTTTDELERLEAVEKVTEEIFGGDPLPTKKDPVTGKDIVNVDALKNDLITKGSENPESPVKKILDAVKTELGLGTSATKDQIIAEIKRLKDIGSSSDYISKVSLASDAKNSLTGLGFSEADINEKLSAAASARDVEVSRNKLVSDRFSELQSKLNNAHYLNIGLGTLSVGILVILTWMILKDRKLLPGQEDEEVKE